MWHVTVRRHLLYLVLVICSQGATTLRSPRRQQSHLWPRRRNTLSRGMVLGHVYFMHPASCIIMVALHAQQHSSNLVHNGPCHAMFCSSFHLCASLPTSTVNSIRGIAHGYSIHAEGLSIHDAFSHCLFAIFCSLQETVQAATAQLE